MQQDAHVYWTAHGAGKRVLGAEIVLVSMWFDACFEGQCCVVLGLDLVEHMDIYDILSTSYVM